MDAPQITRAPYQKGEYEVFCALTLSEPEVIGFTHPHYLLAKLQQAIPSPAFPPSKFELEAQKALVEHALRHGVNFKLHNDHSNLTMGAFMELFEEDHAAVEINGQRHLFADLVKEEWSDESSSLRNEGGFLYRDASGRVIFKYSTWFVIA